MLEWEWANFYSVSGKKGMENCGFLLPLRLQIIHSPLTDVVKVSWWFRSLGAAQRNLTMRERF